MIERQMDIETPEGVMTTFICHPERASPHPPVIFLMDAPGIREELRDMVRRLASVGYYVMLPNLYYRSGVLDVGPIVRDSTGRSQVTGYLERLETPGVMQDCDALVRYLDGDPAAAPGSFGTVGYCMSAQYALNLAARRADRVTAAASIYGTALVTDQPYSLHLAARTAPGELYFACAEIDHFAPLEIVEALRQDLIMYRANAELELYEGCHHGFAFLSRDAYDRDTAERHWERLLSLFRRNLQMTWAGAEPRAG
ncbi:MAG: hydrolase [Bradyrhizobium sp.]|nr:hydrolase [Bradyrhizobium sp.]